MEVKSSILNLEKGNNNVSLKTHIFYQTYYHMTSLEQRSPWIQETNTYTEMWISTVIFCEMKELEPPQVAQY